MYLCSNNHSVSIDVPECPRGFRAGGPESDLCGPDTWNVIDMYFLESCHTRSGTGNIIGNNPDICPCAGRIRSHFNACRKHSGKNKHYFAEDCYGHSGWRLCDCRVLGGHYTADRISDGIPDEPHRRKKHKFQEEVVAHVSLCTDQKETW